MHYITVACELSLVGGALLVLSGLVLERSVRLVRVIPVSQSVVGYRFILTNMDVQPPHRLPRLGWEISSPAQDTPRHHYHACPILYR